MVVYGFAAANDIFNILKPDMLKSALDRCHFDFILRRKQGIVVLGCILLVVVFCGIVLHSITFQRQSSLRLTTKLNLKQLSSAIDGYENYHKRLPKDQTELKAAGMLSDQFNFTTFHYVGGSNGILAFQNKPFQPVKKDEPWGGHGEVAKYDIPSAGLVLFMDGSIQFMDESEFQKKFSFLRGDRDNGGTRDPYAISNLNAELEKLIPGMDLSKWYRQESGYDPDSKWFGDYTTLGVGKELYIGLDTGRPTLEDGALIARFDGEGLDILGSLAEEGIHEMIWDEHGGTLHIAGTDPSWPDDWSAGNHYTYVRSGPKKITKHRDPQNGLVNVIHSWGLWLSGDQVLYAAVNTHDGSFTQDRNILRRILNWINAIFDAHYWSTDYGVTRQGQIFKSIDSGARGVISVTWGTLGHMTSLDLTINCMHSIQTPRNYLANLLRARMWQKMA